MYVRTTGFGTAASGEDTSGGTINKVVPTIVRGGVPTIMPQSGMAGRVVDPSGAGIAGATVRVVASGSSITVTTDASGAFSLQRSPRTYVLLVHAEGIGDTQVGEVAGGAVVSGVVVAAGVVTQVGDIQVGTVVDCLAGETRDPVTGACVPVVVDCLAGETRDPVTGACVPVVVDCLAGETRDPVTGACAAIDTGCPAGTVLDPVTGTCVAEGDRYKVEEPSPWYKSPWVWIGAVVLVGGGVWLATRKG